jgi:uncharacterized membrane protein (DUF2068 family)
MPIKKQTLKYVKAEKRLESPLGVKVISIIYYILAGLYILFALFLIIFSNRLATSAVVSNALDYSAIGTVAVVIIVFGIFLIGLAVLEFFVARGLWRVKNWARILAIILAIIGMVILVFSIMTKFGYTKIVNILIDLGIAVYLLFSREVKKAFRK